MTDETPKPVETPKKPSKFMSRKFLMGLLAMFWIPIVCVWLFKSGLSENVILTVVAGLFTTAGVYKLVQGSIDKLQDPE